MVSRDQRMQIERNLLVMAGHDPTLFPLRMENKVRDIFENDHMYTGCPNTVQTDFERPES